MAQDTILDTISDFLQTSLPYDRENIRSDLRTISKLRAQLIHIKIEAHKELFIAQMKYKRPQEKGMTDFDRRIELNDFTADHQSKYDLAVDLLELLESRREDVRLLYERL